MIILFLVVLSTVNITICVKLWLRRHRYGEVLNIILGVASYIIYSWMAWLVYWALRTPDGINKKNGLLSLLIKFIKLIVVNAKPEALMLYVIFGIGALYISIRRLRVAIIKNV